MKHTVEIQRVAFAPGLEATQGPQPKQNLEDLVLPNDTEPQWITVHRKKRRNPRLKL